MSLFREEALEYRAHRLQGPISLAVPLAWHVIGLVLLASLAVAFLFLALASYSRVETVPGSVVLDRGVPAVVATRPGTVVGIRVRDGDYVVAGEPLAEIRASETLARGNTTAKSILEAMRREQAGLETRASNLAAASRAELERLAAEAGGLRAELLGLDRQIEVQRQLVESAAHEIELVQDVASRGYISRRDVLTREETMLARRQRLAELGQLRSAKLAELTEVQRTMQRGRAEAAAEAAQLAASGALLDQQQIDAEAREGYVLTAPVTGRVTAVTARPGQPVDVDQALMTVIPRSAVVGAELYVPTNAAGFLAIGQEVRLAIDAFPYQRFGTVVATITEISSTTVGRKSASGTAIPVYLVRAKVSRPWVLAFGRRQPLLPGMTFTARIITERQSLIEWLFEPLFAVRGR